MTTSTPRPPIPFARRDARNGVAWLRQAGAMFRAKPLPWLLLLFTYYLLLALARFGPLPPAGAIVALILKPVFAVGFLAAAWTQERGGSPRFEHLFRGFRSNVFALIPLGIVFLAGMTLALRATVLVDGGMFIGFLSGTAPPSEEALIGGRLQMAMLFGGVCALPTLLALWFAPALVVFDDAGAMRALGTSLRAAMANWRAVAAYGATVFAFAGVVPVLVLSLGQLFGDTFAGLLLLFVVAPYLFGFIATLHISDYVSYRDVFHADEPVAPNAGVRSDGY
jgi:hypothetical protein